MALAIVLVLGLCIVLAIRKSLKTAGPEEQSVDDGSLSPASNGSAAPAAFERADASGASAAGATVLAVAATPERPQADEELWETCEVVWWRGYRRSVFAAVAFASDGFPYDVARSPDFKWKRREAPPREAKTLAARDDLTQTLVAAGWEEIARGEGWYGARFRRRRVDAPPAVSDGSTPLPPQFGDLLPDVPAAKPAV